jgi:hypothetical protein
VSFKIVINDKGVYLFRMLVCRYICRWGTHDLGPITPTPPLPSRQAAIDLPDALKMMVKPPFKVHTSTLFDSKRKSFVENVSVLIDPNTGTVVSLEERAGVEVTDLGPDDFDLRGKVAMPGFVDAHTHIFLHSYEYVTVGSDLPARR